MITRPGVRRLALLAILPLLAAPRVAGRTPPIFSVQGRLTRPDGTPAPDGTRSIVFNLWTRQPDDRLWSSQLDVPVVGGFFTAILGEKDPFPEVFPDDGRLFNASWLEVKAGADAPMTPRLRVTPAPSVVRAATVDDGAVSTPAKLGVGVVGTDQIANQSLVNQHFWSSAITPDKLSPDLTMDDPAGGDLEGRFPNPTLRFTPDSLVKVSTGAIAMSAEAPTLDQAQEQHDGEIFRAHWQSFPVTRAGYLTGLDIYCSMPVGDSFNTTLNIYDGDGPSQFPLESTQVFIAKAMSWQHFNLSRPLFVPGAGTKFTWEVQASSGVHVGYAGDASKDVFPGGRNDLTGDYMFRTYVSTLAAGVGATSAPNALLTVAEPAAGNSALLVGDRGRVAPGSNCKLLISEDAATGQWPFQIDRAGNVLYAVRQDGSVFSASSRRVKTNVEPLRDPLGTVMRLQPVSFDWTPAMGGGHDFGLIAEDAAAVMPELAAASPDGTRTAGVRYDRLGVLAVGAIQQQQAALAEDGARLGSIEDRLAALEEKTARGNAARPKQEDHP